MRLNRTLSLFFLCCFVVSTASAASSPCNNLTHASPAFTDITTSPDGNLWFAEDATKTGYTVIRRMTPRGEISEFQVPVRQVITKLIVGPDGNLWFTERAFNNSKNQIGQMTPAGVLKEFQVPGTQFFLEDLVSGPDGNFWFRVSEFKDRTHKIVRMTPSGKITEFPVLSAKALGNITSGPGGNLWFSKKTMDDVIKIVQITPLGKIAEFSFPSSQNEFWTLGGLTQGPDGNLWFTASENVKGIDTVIRMSPEGTFAKFRVPGAKGLSQITSGSDGNLWFAKYGKNLQIARMTMSGKVTTFPTRLQGVSFVSMTNGPDGNIWFIENGNANKTRGITRMTPKGIVTRFPVVSCR